MSDSGGVWRINDVYYGSVSLVERGNRWMRGAVSMIARLVLAVLILGGSGVAYAQPHCSEWLDAFTAWDEDGKTHVNLFDLVPWDANSGFDGVGVSAQAAEGRALELEVSYAGATNSASARFKHLEKLTDGLLYFDGFRPTEFFNRDYAEETTYLVRLWVDGNLACEETQPLWRPSE